MKRSQLGAFITLFLSPFAVLMNLYGRNTSYLELGSVLVTAGVAALVLSVVFLMNLVPTVIQLVQERQADSETYQTEFKVEAKTETPNVYWIHCDGMLSPATVEKYWDYDGTAFRKALAENGFTLYQDAMLEASHFTTVAIPELMSPYFYDHTLRAVLEADPDDHDAGRTFIKANPKLMREALRQNETIAAFHQAGYTTNVLSLNTNDYFFPVNADHFYAIADHNLHKEEAYAAELAAKPYLLLDDPYAESDAVDKYINLGELAGGSAGRTLA